MAVWDIAQRPHVLTHTIASLPLADRVPIEGVPLGPRDFSWRATDPATIVWAEALDGGDWNVNVPARDKILLLKAPFNSPAAEVARTEQRYTAFAWSEQSSVALLAEYDNNRHWRRSFVIDVDDQQTKPRLIWDVSTDERYKNPGYPVRRQLANGPWVVRQDADSIYLAGAGASPEGDRPFLDRLNLTTLKAEACFGVTRPPTSDFFPLPAPTHGPFSPGINRQPTRQMLSRERWEHPSMRSPASRPLLQPASPSLTFQIPRRRCAPSRSGWSSTSAPMGLTCLSRSIRRPDIRRARALLPFSTLILSTSPMPPRRARLPARSKRSRSCTNTNCCSWGGYAIIDNASFPIIGDPKRAYDTYLEQLVADAKAAVDEAVRLGVADPGRVGVTGHSHGALMTANLVAHSDLFRAGVATSGFYNKTLTPFGFQNERRSVWEASDVYLKVSPFFFADKLKTPLLIMHGAEDANPGTTPLQSSKLYEAIRGNGGTTRLVILPHEPHWYTALESNEQLIYEMLRWFDKYVKDAPPRPVTTAE